MSETYPPVVEAPGDQEGELSAENGWTIDRVQPVGMRDGDDWIISTAELNRLLNAVRAEGRPSPEPEPVRAAAKIDEIIALLEPVWEAQHPNADTPLGLALTKLSDLRAAISSPEPGGSEFVRVPPDPPWPPGPDNAKRAGWEAFHAGRARNPSPFPPNREDLHRGYREGWDAAQEASQGSVTATRSALPADTVRSEGGDP